jgi:hypothetical protein
VALAYARPAQLNVNLPIVQVEIDPPKAFSIFFENGWTLTIFDDSPQYEAFAVHVDGRASVYI